MTTPAPIVTGSAADRSTRGDALLLSGTVVSAVLVFSVLAVPPYVVEGFAPPAGLDALWALGGSLSLVLAPIAAALAGAACGWTLWRRRDLGATTRRLHVLGVAVSLAFVAFLVSAPGRALVAWWQD